MVFEEAEKKEYEIKRQIESIGSHAHIVKEFIFSQSKEETHS